LILGIFLMYFYSGLQNDHVAAITPYFLELGWKATTITDPATVGTFVVAFVYFLIGTLMLKYGVTKVLVPSIVLLGLACAGFSMAGDSFLMYTIFLFFIRLFVAPLQMGAYMLCTNWFVNLRGRALGLITIGCPLFTATGIPGIRIGVTKAGFAPTYIIISVLVFILAVLVTLFVKSSPEDCGLYPDGSDREIETSSGEIKSIPLREVFANIDSWLLTISFGILQFCIVAVIAFYPQRLIMVGTKESIYLTWLAIAAVAGTPISFILGMIDDKFGTVIASLALCITFFIGLISLLVMTANNIPLLFLAAMGIAGMTGGTPNLHPSITTYVWGRDRYQAANRWIMAIQAFMMALALRFMAMILDITGSLDLAYKIMLWLVGIAIVCLAIIGRKPDYDRGGVRRQDRLT
jgi:MFS family permease